MVTTLDTEFAHNGRFDPEHWAAFTGLHGNLHHELQAFTASDVSVQPGAGLILTTERRPFLDHPFSSGEVTTRGLFSQAYGHFEMMARLPQANGLWPAFWLMPITNGWPPEIDVVEYVFAPNGRLPSRQHHVGSNPQTTLHWLDQNGRHGQAGQGFNSDIDYFSTYEDWDETPPPAGAGPGLKGYHDYAIDWRPGSLTWFVDGKPVFCLADNAATGPRVPDQPMYMIIDDAVTPGTPQHPGWPGFVAPDQAFPQKMAVAFVKVAKFKDLPAAPVPDLEVRAVKASAVELHPGQRIDVSAELRVGPHALDGNHAAQFTLKAFDSSAYFGIGSNVATAGITLGPLAPMRRYPLRTTFVVPGTMRTGQYSLGFVIAYKPARDAAGRTVYAGLEQAEVVTVTAPTGPH